MNVSSSASGRDTATRVRRLAFVAVSLLLAAAPRSHAEPEHPGAALYRQHCAACHGESGTGDGPVADALLVKPADLTTISRRSGGRFPFWEVMKTIDGRSAVRGHGRSDMPVWGKIFRDDAGWDFERRARVQGKITFLTEYVESLQKK